MAIRLVISGSTGHMGQTVIKQMQSDPEFCIVGETRGREDLEGLIKKTHPDIVIDFTNARVARKNMLIILEGGARPVIGTSGFGADDISAINTYCLKNKKGAIIAPNFCIAVVLMMEFAQRASLFFEEAEIIEKHHEGKTDAPSATALKTAEIIAAARQQLPNLKDLLEIIPGARGAMSEKIPIHSVRLPGIMAEQEVIFGHAGGTLRISHNTINREVYMPGIRLACRKVMELDHLVYGLEHLL